MSKSRYLWWGYINNMLKGYPHKTSKAETEAIDKALSITGNLIDGAERIKAVRLVFFDDTHKIAGAALNIHCSEDTVQNWLRDFKFLVAEQYGLTKDYPKMT